MRADAFINFLKKLRGEEHFVPKIGPAELDALPRTLGERLAAEQGIGGYAERFRNPELAEQGFAKPEHEEAWASLMARLKNTVDQAKMKAGFLEDYNIGDISYNPQTLAESTLGGQVHLNPRMIAKEAKILGTDYPQELSRSLTHEYSHGRGRTARREHGPDFEIAQEAINEALGPHGEDVIRDQMSRDPRLQELVDQLGIDEGLQKRYFYPSQSSLRRAGAYKELTETDKMHPKLDINKIVPPAAAPTKAKNLIEQASGKNIQYDEATNIITWTDANGKQMSANLNERFGPRNLGINPRAVQENPRFGSRNPRITRETDELFLDPTGKTKLPPKGDLAAIPPIALSYELAKPSAFSSLEEDLDPRTEMERSELPWIQNFLEESGLGIGQAFASPIMRTGAGLEERDISKVLSGAGEQALGMSLPVVGGALAKGGKAALKSLKLPAAARKAAERTLSEATELTSAGIGAPPRKMPRTGVVRSEAIPDILSGIDEETGKAIKLGQFPNLASTVPGSKRKIKFASPFDQAAYNLTLGAKPNPNILAMLKKRTGFNEDTLLQHGHKIARNVAIAAEKTKGAAAPIKLHPRSVEVIDVPEGMTAKDFGTSLLNTLAFPSAFKFSIDLPAMRQSLKPFLLHPVKSGLPALKAAGKSITEKGHREEVTKLLESPTYDLLETAQALGPKLAKEMFPNIEQLQKLSSSDLIEYFTGLGLAEKTPILGKYLVKPSARMFDVFQKRIRGAELERLASAAGTNVEGLARNPDLADEARAMVRRVNDETGAGPLGWLEQASTPLSGIMTAPRNLSSKLMMMNPLNYVPESAVRKLGVGGDWLANKGIAGRYGSDTAYWDFLKDQAKFYGGLGALAGGSAALGANVELDPASSLFGIRYGNYQPDISGGDLPIARAVYRSLISPRRESSREEEYAEGGIRAAEKFFRSRLRPGLASMSYDFSNLGYNPKTGENENVMGEAIRYPYAEGTPGREALDWIGAASGSNELGEMPYSRWIAEQFTPATAGDIYDAFKIGGPAAGATASTLGLLGLGSSTFDPYGPKNPYFAPLKQITIEKGGKKPSRKGRRKLIT